MSELTEWQERFFDEGMEILAREGAETGLRQAVLALYGQQKEAWPMLTEAVSGLDNTAVRGIELDGRTVRLQHNPARMVNVSAPTSPDEVARRPCPICPRNMPAEQKALPFFGDWLVVCNPLPIFKRHFVLVYGEHVSQSAAAILPAMMEFTRLTGFVSLYNGPRCGASIPDHLHIQAAPPGWLPLEQQLPEQDGREIVVDQRLPGRIFIRARETGRARHLFARTMEALEPYKIDPEDTEPGMNVAVIAGGSDEAMWIVVHPRSRHRPECFYEEGENRYVVSPGSTDMAGLIILPRPEDFRRLDSAKVRSIYREVCLTSRQLERVAQALEG